MSNLCADCLELKNECTCWRCHNCWNEDTNTNLGISHAGIACRDCCGHSDGWWRLGEGYGYDNDMYACRAGCGEVRERKTLKNERLFSTQSKKKQEEILRATAIAQGQVLSCENPLASQWNWEWTEICNTGAGIDGVCTRGGIGCDVEHEEGLRAR